VPALPDGMIGIGLVGVEALDATAGQSLDELGSKAGGQRSKIRFGFRNHVVQRYLPLEVGWIE